jgi:hypothetical protein
MPSGLSKKSVSAKMDDYSLEIDPFERRHVGKHGAFIFRANRAFAARAAKAAAQRQLEESGSRKEGETAWR